MFVAMTAFAVWCGFAAITPLWLNQMLIGAIWVAVSGSLLTGIVFAKNDQRAFCIGALVVVASMWTRSGGMLMEGMQQFFNLAVEPLNLPRTVGIWIDLALLLALAFANGLLCVRAKAFFERNQATPSD